MGPSPQAIPVIGVGLPGAGKGGHPVLGVKGESIASVGSRVAVAIVSNGTADGLVVAVVGRGVAASVDGQIAGTAAGAVIAKGVGVAVVKGAGLAGELAAVELWVCALSIVIGVEGRAAVAGRVPLVRDVKLTLQVFQGQ